MEKVVCNKVSTHIQLIEKVRTAAARAVLPVYRTTRSAALFRESGLDTAELALNKLSRRAAIRTRRLDPLHPLWARAQNSLASPALSRFARSCRDIPASEQVDSLVNPPWENIESRQNSHIRVCDPSVPKHMIANTFRIFLRTLPRSDILVFSDGSKLSDGRTGSGFVIYQFGTKVCSNSFPLGQHKECFYAETFAALPSARFSNDIWVFIDNEEVARKLLTRTPMMSAQSIFLQAIEVAKVWKARTRLPHTLAGSINIRWVSSHPGIDVNELADLEAKKGASLPSPENQEYSFATLEQWQSILKRQERDDWWRNHSPPSY
ncbi:hypothetical protein K3495_g4378 [Podosphaera aphanis]|nr:hypothetical protein K3495_g4378 [Podosphaera aphanis]